MGSSGIHNAVRLRMRRFPQAEPISGPGNWSVGSFLLQSGGQAMGKQALLGVLVAHTPSCSSSARLCLPAVGTGAGVSPALKVQDGNN